MHSACSFVILLTSAALATSFAQDAPKKLLEESCAANIECVSYCCYEKACDESILCLRGVKRKLDYCDRDLECETGCCSD